MQACATHWLYLPPSSRLLPPPPSSRFLLLTFSPSSVILAPPLPQSHHSADTTPFAFGRIRFPAQLAPSQGMPKNWDIFGHCGSPWSRSRARHLGRAVPTPAGQESSRTPRRIAGWLPATVALPTECATRAHSLRCFFDKVSAIASVLLLAPGPGLGHQGVSGSKAALRRMAPMQGKQKPSPATPRSSWGEMPWSFNLRGHPCKRTWCSGWKIPAFAYEYTMLFWQRALRLPSNHGFLWTAWPTSHHNTSLRDASEDIGMPLFCAWPRMAFVCEIHPAFNRPERTPGAPGRTGRPACSSKGSRP